MARLSQSESCKRARRRAKCLLGLVTSSRLSRVRRQGRAFRFAHFKRELQRVTVFLNHHNCCSRWPNYFLLFFFLAVLGIELRASMLARQAFYPLAFFYLFFFALVIVQIGSRFLPGIGLEQQSK
jgi:hypothetical protein